MQKSTLTETLFTLFFRSSHLISRGHHHQAGGHHHQTGGHHGQLRILSILNEENTMSQKDLMEVLQVRSASLSELLSKIESNGYITRTKDEDDKRNVIITITEKGKTVISENEQQWHNEAEKLFAALNEEEQNTLSKLLHKLVTSWQQERGASDSERNQQRHSSIHDEDHCDAHHHGYHHGNSHHGEHFCHCRQSDDEE
jgi:DNA-binding MarR family transcriptional regulator